MKETRAYKALKKAHPDAHWTRIESHINPGIFDVNGCKHGIEIWFECKQFKKPAKPTTLIKLDTKKRSVRDQIAWGIRRRKSMGKTFYALMIGSEMILIDGHLTKLLIRGMIFERLKQLQTHRENLFV